MDDTWFHAEGDERRGPVSADAKPPHASHTFHHHPGLTIAGAVAACPAGIDAH